MTTVKDQAYQEALGAFSGYFQWLHRAAGEPPYTEVGRHCAISIATVHRYLHGITLPRWQFCEKYLTRYGTAIEHQLGPDAATELKDLWMAARNVLNPITPPIPATPPGTRRLTAVTTGPPARRIA